MTQPRTTAARILIVDDVAANRDTLFPYKPSSWEVAVRAFPGCALRST